MLNQQILASIEEGKKLPDLQSQVRQELSKNPKVIIVLDDDPTGTQTVFDIPVITLWTEEAIEKEILNSPIFFVLTNSRSLQANEANALGRLIGERLQTVAKKHGKEIVVISRSDSTLRGHYPNEVDALASGLGWVNTKHIIAPAFFEGGRYTFNDIHYVKDGNDFIPAGETPFAKDNTFGYNSSNLKDWVEEKTNGRTKSNEVTSIPIGMVRNLSTDKIIAFLSNENSNHIILNATCYEDLRASALACLLSNAKFIYRTGASFVNAISGIELRECLDKKEILPESSNKGALVIIGSYVPKTTAQLNYLKEQHSKAVFLELDVAQLIDENKFKSVLKQLTDQINNHIDLGETVVLYTSRLVIKGETKVESLEIVNKVSSGLISIVTQLQTRPKYVLAKGGITSSDVAAKGLKVQRAMILGQIIKGIPIWKLGEEAKFPELPYIVFPGNVGDNHALYDVIKILE